MGSEFTWQTLQLLIKGGALLVASLASVLNWVFQEKDAKMGFNMQEVIRGNACERWGGSRRGRESHHLDASLIPGEG